jgi:hypothetical protein
VVGSTRSRDRWHSLRNACPCSRTGSGRPAASQRRRCLAIVVIWRELLSAASQLAHGPSSTADIRSVRRLLLLTFELFDVLVHRLIVSPMIASGFPHSQSVRQASACYRSACPISHAACGTASEPGRCGV